MDIAELNKEQLDAVQTAGGNMLILAGAGSGKTRVITYRIAYLINHGVSPSNILALTFTNKAANEMKDRLSSILSEEFSPSWIGTFHSICLRILRMNIEKVNYKKEFVIYDTYDQTAIIKDCMKQLNISPKIKPSFFLSKISDFKNRFKSPNECGPDKEKDSSSIQIQEIYDMYQKRLYSANAIDFDDIIFYTVKILEEYEEIRSFYQGKFKHILVDEYQDTNYLQYRFIKILSEKHQNLCVVGDDDQSIYRWRGADVRNILEFEKDHKDTKIIKLEQNYRSTQTILNVAYDVISKNIGRMNKKLWTENGTGELIILKKLYSEKEEGAWVANQIKELVDKFDYSLDEIAVLYRANAQSRAIEDAFVLKDMPYQVFGGIKFYDRKEIKDLLAYLRLISNTSDISSFRRIINIPKRGIGIKTIEKIEFNALSDSKTVYEYLLSDELLDFSVKVRKNLKNFISMMETFRSMSELIPLDELIETILDHTGYRKELEEEKTEEANNRLENLREFLSVAKDFYQTKEKEEGLSDFLFGLSLATEQNEDEMEGKVSLMTLHSAKGLEFRAVFIVGMEEGLFPISRAVYDEYELEEERRLCYVGITRAKEKLYLTYTGERMIYGKTEKRVISRFVKDIDSKYISGNLHDSLEQGKTLSLYQKYREKYKVGLKTKKKDDSFPQDAQKISLGSKVKHKVFGIGTVVAREEGVYTIVFDSKGIKKIDTKYVNLEVLS